MEEFHEQFLSETTDLLLTLDFYFLNYKRYQFLICLKGFLKLKIEQCINGLF